jgi:uncharacterized flavoprotein (TIGR03862 family)
LSPPPPEVAVVGAGPAGLMAAETLARGGAARVTVLDRMPSPARKLLIAGRGGLNLTHGEPLGAFLDRYGAARPFLEPAIRRFPPAALVAWCEGLGQETFVGSSGRVFPRAMKASPLLRAWLARLGALGVALRPRHRWRGWDAAGSLRFEAPDGPVALRADAVVLALGGASWPRLGSDGAWPALLPGVDVAPLRPANCGFLVAWSDHLRARFAGAPLKRVALSFGGRAVRGEAVVTEAGIEGGAVYALSAAIREAIAARGGPVTPHLDLRPDLDAAALAARLDGPRGGVSLANRLRRAGFPPVAAALVQEARRPAGDAAGPPSRLAKALPLRLLAPAPIAGAISSAGGIARGELDERFMLRRRPGVFACGEMLDWEAPTGGYLLQACFATGVAAAEGALGWLGDEGRRG